MARGLVWVLVALATLPFAATVLHLVGDSVHGGEPRQSGTALVRRCEEQGPISGHGYGYWWICDAEVRWADGTTTRERFRGSTLRPVDAGIPVPVNEYRFTRSSGGGRERVVLRDEDRPWAWAGPFLALPVGFTAFLLAGRGLWVMLPRNEQERITRETRESRQDRAGHGRLARIQRMAEEKAARRRAR